MCGLNYDAPDDLEPAIDRSAQGGRARAFGGACAPRLRLEIASAACLKKSSEPIPAAHSASAYLVRLRVRVRVGVGVRVGVRVRVRG